MFKKHFFQIPLLHVRHAPGPGSRRGAQPQTRGARGEEQTEEESHGWDFDLIMNVLKKNMWEDKREFSHGR